MSRRLGTLLLVVLLGATGGAGCTTRSSGGQTPDGSGAGSSAPVAGGTAPAQVSVGGAVALPSLAVPRASHTATALPDGRVLIAGGCTTRGCGGTAEGGRSELFDPRSRRFVPGSALLQARAGHTATALLDGGVLIAGGFPEEARPPLSSVELFHARAGSFTATGSMGTPRGGHTATRLRDGRVLVVGGHDGIRVVRTAEVYAPSTGAFRAVAPMPTPRATHAATLLGDGRVLVVGGQSTTGHGNGIIDTALVYDPARDSWHEVGRLAQAKYKLAVAPLPGGSALVVGGQTSDDRGSRLAGTELFEPATGGFRPGPVMAEPRYKIADAVAALPDGRLVVAGGFGVEVFRAGAFHRVAGTPDTERQFPAVATLPDGQVLVTGGYDDLTRITASAVLINPG